MITAYFNCSHGIAGDMILAACIDAGVPSVQLERTLKRQLGLSGWSFQTKVHNAYHYPVHTLQVTGVRVFDSPAEMLRIIKKSSLPAQTRKNSLCILQRLISTEAKVHGVSEKKAHFHELNSIDTIIDITGACTALAMLGAGQVVASPINTGAPAPATVEIMASAGIPVYADTHEHELTTPTGSAIISVLASRFGPMPLMSLQKCGYGAGTKIIPGKENVLRLLVGRTLDEQSAGYAEDRVVLMETNIDDMDPRAYPYVMERLLKAGARDAWLSQVIMKKGRPGIVLSVISGIEQEFELLQILFTETTTLGVRRSPLTRYLLQRQQDGKSKTALLPGGARRMKAEYEHARKAAEKHKTPLISLLK